jgi:hypothetical protein
LLSIQPATAHFTGREDAEVNPCSQLLEILPLSLGAASTLGLGALDYPAQRLLDRGAHRRLTGRPAGSRQQIVIDLYGRALHDAYIVHVYAYTSHGPRVIQRKGRPGFPPGRPVLALRLA